MPTILERFGGFVPDLATVLLVAPAALACAGLAAAAAARLRRRGVRVPYTRKLFHFVIFTGASAVQLWRGLPGVTVFGGVVAGVVLGAVYRGRGDPFFEALARPSDEPHPRRFILVPLLTTAVGGGLANLLFPGYAYIGYLVCGWGDAAGEPVGTRWGRHRFRVPAMAGVSACRSWEGSAAVFVTGTAAALLGLLAAGRTLPEAALTALAAGAAGAAVEAFTTHGLDNFSVQLAASAAAWLV
jgi:phytol kinase